MFFFRFRWLRKFVRHRTKPIPEDSALTWKKRTTFAYVFLAWNTLGFVAYSIHKGKVKPPDDNDPLSKLSPGHQWAVKLGKENAQVYRIDGFSIKKIEKEQISSDEHMKDSNVEN